MKHLRIIAFIIVLSVLALPLFIILFISPSVTNLVEDNAKEESLRLAEHLTSLLISEERAIASGVLPPTFSAEAEKLKKDFDLIDLEVYSAAGVVIYSTNSNEIGHVSNEDYFSGAVAKRGIHSSVMRKGVMTREGDVPEVDMAETYVPLIKEGRFLGAFEIYIDITKKIDKLNALLRRFYILLFIVTAGLMAAAITALYRAGMNLSERDIARKEWEMTFDAVTDPVMILDPQFRMKRMNKAMAESLGVAPEKAVGKICYQEVHKTDMPMADCPHVQLLQDGNVHTAETYEERMGRHYSITVFPMLDPEGKLTATVHYAKDITKRKQAEEALQRQLKNMTALNDIGIAISSSLDLKVTLNMLLERLTSQLNIDAATVLLLDQETLYLNCAASLGFRTASSLKKTSVKMGKGNAGRAAYERRLLIIPDLRDTLTQAFREEEFKAYIAVPLMAQGKVKGVLEIFQRSTFDPSTEWLGFLEPMSTQAAIAIDNAAMFDSLQRSNMDLTLSYDATIEGWGRTLEFRDEDTMGHTKRVTEMTVRFARLMGMDEKDILHLRRGAMLHDIGKISIPDNILLKEGPLTNEERDIMNRHPHYAYELLYPIPFLRAALDIPYCHHEKWDGTGYPRGLKEEKIPFAARIFAVVDVCDALLSNRPYRAAWPLEKVREHVLSLSGRDFDPAVVETFLKILDEQGGKLFE
jgi:PAS domain S-box-containing protein